MKTGAGEIAGAWWYLIRTQNANRWRSTVRKLRNPRYLIAILLGFGYIFGYLRFLAIGRPGPSTATFVTQVGQVVAVFIVMMMAVWFWVFSGDPSALAFTPAEVSFLFPGPVSRRQLILYKLFGTQLRLFFNVVLWVAILRRGSPNLPIPLRAIGTWVFFTTTSFHRTGAALVRTSWTRHGLTGVRKHRVAVALVLAVVLCIAISLFRALHALESSTDGKVLIANVSTALTAWPAGIVLWPIHAVVAPVLARNPSEWLLAMPAALAIMLAHGVWVVQSDAAFEEAALAASAAQAARIEAWKARRIGGTSSPAKFKLTKSPKLVPTGEPSWAIVWKNFICLRRRAEIKMIMTLVGVTALSAVIGRAVHGGPGVVASATIVAGLVVAVELSLLGPMLLRIDLRQDMLNLVQLKLMPLSGRRIVRAEILSGVLPVAVIQMGALAAVGIAGLFAPDREVALIDGAIRGLCLAAGLIAFDTTAVVVMNGAPVLFPSWTRLGTTVGGGVEVLGQGLMSALLVLLIIILTLLLPGGAAAGIIYLGVNHLRWVLPLATIVATAGIAFELWIAMGILGGALERTEPSEVR